MYENIIKNFDNYNEKISTHFNSFHEKISSNLKKMHMGVLHPTVMKVIDKILNEEIKKIIESSRSNLAEIQKALADGLTKTVETIPS